MMRRGDLAATTYVTREKRSNERRTLWPQLLRWLCWCVGSNRRFLCLKTNEGGGIFFRRFVSFIPCAAWHRTYKAAARRTQSEAPPFTSVLHQSKWITGRMTLCVCVAFCRSLGGMVQFTYDFVSGPVKLQGAAKGH